MYISPVAMLVSELHLNWSTRHNAVWSTTLFLANLADSIWPGGAGVTNRLLVARLRQVIVDSEDILPSCFTTAQAGQQESSL